MKINKLWECIKTNNRDYVIFMKYGNFYKVYGDDIYIIWKITGYKVIDDHHIGFPLKSINGILKKLGLLHISYIIYDKEDDYMSVKEINNKYDEVMNSGKEDYLDEKRIKGVVSNFEAKIRNDSAMLDYYERKL